MRTKKNSTGVLILLVFFIVLTLLLGGYIVYDKVLSKNETPENPNTNINTPAKEDQKSLSKNFSKSSLSSKICCLLIPRSKI